MRPPRCLSLFIKNIRNKEYLFLSGIGIRLSWDIDKSVAEYCKKNNIKWLQFQRDGIIRG